jgi:hypothetical protein
LRIRWRSFSGEVGKVKQITERAVDKFEQALKKVRK